MNDDFPTLYAYNRWANQKVLDVCRKLTPEQYAAEPAPGWSSVRQTLTHIAIATEGWLRGLTGENVEKVLTEAEMPTVDDAAWLLDKADQIVESLLSQATPQWLTTPVTLRRRNQSVALPPWSVLRHLVNHATYHRGQISSKLKRFGIQQPDTDFIYWVFEQMPRG